MIVAPQSSFNQITAYSFTKSRSYSCLSLLLPSGLSSFRKDIEAQLHQGSQQHGPKWDTHKWQLHVGQFLQLGTQSQAEAQFEQHGRQVPRPQTQVWRAIPWVVAWFAASGHLNSQHEDEDTIEHPDGEEDEEPVPLNLGKQKVWKIELNFLFFSWIMLSNIVGLKNTTKLAYQWTIYRSEYYCWCLLVYRIHICASVVQFLCSLY